MFKKNITFKLTLGFLTIVIVSTLFIGIIALNMFKNNIYEIKKNNIIFHTTLGLNGSISDVGLTMHYAIGKSDTTTLLSIKSNGDVYFEGVKAPCEGNK